jgi:hypothetical protein
MMSKDLEMPNPPAYDEKTSGLIDLSISAETKNLMRKIKSIKSSEPFNKINRSHSYDEEDEIAIHHCAIVKALDAFGFREDETDTQVAQRILEEFKKKDTRHLAVKNAYELLKQQNIKILELDITFECDNFKNKLDGIVQTASGLGILSLIFKQTSDSDIDVQTDVIASSEFACALKEEVPFKIYIIEFDRYGNCRLYCVDPLDHFRESNYYIEIIDSNNQKQILHTFTTTFVEKTVEKNVKLYDHSTSFIRPFKQEMELISEFKFQNRNLGYYNFDHGQIVQIQGPFTVFIYKKKQIGFFTASFSSKTELRTVFNRVHSELKNVDKEKKVALDFFIAEDSTTAVDRTKEFLKFVEQDLPMSSIRKNIKKSSFTIEHVISFKRNVCLVYVE